MEAINRSVEGDNVSVRYDTQKVSHTQSAKRVLPPRLVSTLYGRAEIFTRAVQSLEQNEPVVLHGMAGMGKSALASAIAWSVIENYANGVLWIDGGYNPLDAICDNIGQQFEDEQMLKLEANAKPSRVRYLLGLHNVLVVLDDCWDSDVAREFAQLCVPAGYSLLVTSREKIARMGSLIEVTPLEHPSGTELFRDASGIKGTSEADQVAKLVRLLGGHPQGLVIAGALCLEEELSARELLTMLGPAEKRAKMLRLGKDASNNVWATFDLSYQRLKPEEQIVFRTFGGSWSKTATSELLSYIVLADEDTVDRAMRGLVKRALARVEELANGRRRYAVHDLIHAFAQGLIKEGGQSIDDARNEWLSAAQQYASKYASETADSHSSLDAEFVNLMGAANWAAERRKFEELNNLTLILASKSGFLNRRGYNLEAVGLLTLAVEGARTLGNDKDEGVHLGSLAYAYALLSNYSLALEHYQQALRIAQSVHDKASEGHWYGLMGFVYDSVGEYSEAIKCYSNAIDICKSLNDKVGQGRWLGSLAGTYRTVGESETAIKLYREAIALARRIGDEYNECVHLSNLGNAYRTWGDYETAIKYYDEALAQATKIGDRATQARSLVNAGRLHARLGKPAEGLDKCRQALEIFSEIGFGSGQAYAHGYMGEVLRVLGNVEEAGLETRNALELHRELGVRNGEADWLHNLGIWALAGGQREEGVDYLKAALKIRTDLGIAKADETLQALKDAGVDVE